MATRATARSKTALTTRSKIAVVPKRKPTIIIKDRVYIPVQGLNIVDVKEEYTKSLYDEQACRSCEHKHDRHCYLCDTCEAFKKTYKMYAMKERNGTQFIGLPVGDKKNIERKAGILFSEYRIRDLRVEVPFTVPIKVVVDLRPHQVELSETFFKHNYGLIEAPPRTGKTLLLLYICIMLGQRTVILANQHEFLDQFLDHIHGNVKEGIPKCTNLPELEKKHGRKLYGFPKTDEDFETFQIMVCTYQQFISEKNGRDRFNKIKNNVGTVGVDEVHKSAADFFAKVIARFPARYRVGVSGTMDRKDGKQFLVKHIMGPVVAKTSVEALTPTVYLHETPVEGKKYAPGRRSWGLAMQYLSKHKKRNAFIVDRVMKDLKNGHNIVIPVVYKHHVVELQRLINEAYGKHICGTFVGGGGKKNKDDRKALLTQAKENKIRVIVGIRSLLQLGLNVPTWSCIYTVIPISNRPNYKQETSRVRTPMAGKRSPVVRIFVDYNQGQSVGCAKACIKDAKVFGYEFSNSDVQKALRAKLGVSGRRGSDDPEAGSDSIFKATRAWSSDGSKTVDDKKVVSKRF